MYLINSSGISVVSIKSLILRAPSQGSLPQYTTNVTTGCSLSVFLNKYRRSPPLSSSLLCPFVLRISTHSYRSLFIKNLCHKLSFLPIKATSLSLTNRGAMRKCTQRSGSGVVECKQNRRIKKIRLYYRLRILLYYFCLVYTSSGTGQTR